MWRTNDKTLLAAAAATLHLAYAIPLDVNSADSIRSASVTLAHGLMSWYHNNQSSTAQVAIGTFSQVYWWEAGAVWGGMIDYWSYTDDTSYVPTVQQALMAQVGPDKNYMPPAYNPSLGADDQAFWALAVLNALEYGFPVPDGQPSSVYLDLAEAVFNTQWPRWDTTSCNGGLKWQIFQFNPGYDYKNSVSNGAFFQIAARLARYTGNQTYVDWTERIWDWMRAVNLIDAQYRVFDGTDDTLNCSQVNHIQWSYNPSLLLYGTAMLYNITNGSDLWANRTTGLLESCAKTFFSPYGNATDIAFESACEPGNNCNYDEQSFKAYLARWLAKSSVVAPFIATRVNELLTRSAEAAAQACSGGEDGTTCGQKWYVGGYDGVHGIGQELSALETVQSLLLLRRNVNASHMYPATSTTNAVLSPTVGTGGGDPQNENGGGVRAAPSGSTKSGATDTVKAHLAGSGAWAMTGLVVLAGLAVGGGLGFL